MSSNKFPILLSFAAMLVTAGSQAQVTTGGSYNWRDSSLIPASRAAQQNEFLNNQYNYPAKPRSQWELGVKAGEFHVNGDVNWLPNFGFGGHVRKSLGYAFSLRLEYMHGIGKGLSWQQSYNYAKNTAWKNNGYIPNVVDNFGNRLPARDVVYYNYKSNVNDLAIQGILSLNNILFHKSKPKTNVYVLGGVGLTWYKTFVNALDGTARYNFSNITSNPAFADRADIRKALRNLLDNSYETRAEAHSIKKSRMFGDATSRGSGMVGAGVSFKLTPRVNLSIEERITFVQDDLLDGQRWQEYAHGDAAQTRNFDSYNYLTAGLNFNLGRSARSVEPLYWLNPLDFAYGELNSPKRMKLPKPVLDDADGDGVTDQFDNEPNTPAGCPVDSHGVSRDTDGDGVADCKDKQLITPTECQPVDADGVGKCPEPACCTTKPPVNDCSKVSMPSVSFKNNSADLSKDAESALTTFGESLRNSPSCKVVVTGYGEPSKAGQQLSWDRVNSVINFLVDKQGISANRFIFRHGQTGGDPNTVDVRAAGEGEDGPNTVPAPHPNLRKNK
jgi:outer membrane protein OmpA-like peptidoglycan-associated protein/opacity protein-like surface antigen